MCANNLFLVTHPPHPITVPVPYHQYHSNTTHTNTHKHKHNPNTCTQVAPSGQEGKGGSKYLAILDQDNVDHAEDLPPSNILPQLNQLFQHLGAKGDCWDAEEEDLEGDWSWAAGVL